MFDGVHLDGWIKRGGNATYQVQDGVIVGTTQQGGANTFLCTQRDYDDFILELEYLVDPAMNSGIQIRSLSKPDYHNGVVHGYQVEIDPSPRAWSGGIYDESRRGWLYPLKDHPKAQAAFQQNQWNHYRIEAVGDSIRTWVNGIPAADLRDSLNLSGFIALQVHGTNRKEPMQIKWRNIRIQDLGKHRWKPLFNGKDLSGWHALPGGKWEVVDGAIRGTSEASEPRHGLLVSNQTYDDFTRSRSFKVTEEIVDFIFALRNQRWSRGHGFQVRSGYLLWKQEAFETGGRAWVVEHPADKKTSWYRKESGTKLRSTASASPFMSMATDPLPKDSGRLSGHLALQLHGVRICG